MKTLKDFKKMYGEKSTLEKNENEKCNITYSESYAEKKSYNQVFLGLKYNTNNYSKYEIGKNLFNKLISQYKELVDKDNIKISTEVYIAATTLVNWLLQDRVICLSTETKPPIIDYSKGFLFAGSTGTGKTTLMQAFSLLCIELNPSLIFFSHGYRAGIAPIKVRANSILENFLKDGIKGISRYWSIKPKEKSGYFLRYDTLNNASYNQPDRDCYPCLFIDDLATGNTVGNQKAYGATIDINDMIIKNRYDEDLLTFATSNVYSDESLQMSTKDRYNSMFNVILFTGDSYRK